MGVGGADAPKSESAAPPEEFLQKALREQMKRDEAGKKEDGVNMTKDEAEKFQKAFQEPEFRKLMADYVAEISDPKNRAEQDAYIRQLEGQGEVPEDKEVIRPTPHYTVKFKHVKVKVREHAEKEGKPWEKQKMFVNIVSSDKVQACRSENVVRDGKKGQQWLVPHSLGPVRMEVDKNESNVATLDFCVHTETVELSLRNVPFRDLLVETAREACEK
jgi:dynein assembly factor 2